MSLGTDHPRKCTVQHRMQFLRIKGRTGVKGEGFDAVFFVLGGVVGKAIQLFCPHGVFMGGVKVEQAGVENGISRQVRVIGFDDPGVTIQGADDLARIFCAGCACICNLVEDHNIGKFDLFGEQADQTAVVFFAQRFAAVVEKVMAGEIL